MYASFKLLFAAPFLLTGLGLINSGYPPERFQGDATVQTSFLSQEGIERVCGKPKPPLLIRGCVQRDIFGRAYMVVPHPMDVTEEEFRRIVAHEIGHVRGWSREHED